MLVLGRKLGEKVMLDLPSGERVTLTVVDIDRGKVRIGIAAPPAVAIYRQELLPNPWPPKEAPDARD